MTRKILLISALVAGSLVLQGCAGLTTLGAGSGTAAGAGAGVEHTLNGAAYKTFTASVDQVHAASRRALADMSVKITDDARTENGRQLMAVAADREIEIQFEWLTPRMTRMRVVAAEGVLFRDSATATEIILQTAERLETRTAATARR